MNDLDDELLLAERLQRLGSQIQTPANDLAGDVRRGRVRLRRQRAFMAGVAVVAVAGMSVGAALLHGGGHELEPAGGPATASDSSRTSASASPSPSAPAHRADCIRTPDVSEVAPWRTPPVAGLLRDYRDAVARHLDPSDDHLQRRVSGMQAGGGRCLTSLGTKLGWSVTGQDGLGMIQVEVGGPWSDSEVHLAHDGWRTVPTTLPNVAEAREVTYDGGVAVSITRDDGTVVSLDADRLFGNNSLTPIQGFDFTVDDLLATAADPGFKAP